YDNHRDLLREASPTRHLPDILGKKDGIAALAKFVVKSDSFTKTATPRPKRTITSFEDEPEGDEDRDEEDD
ncbi:hypothetical protein DFH09DRAFT_877169, partial [Mycena vulgaris]